MKNLKYSFLAAVPLALVLGGDPVHAAPIREQPPAAPRISMTIDGHELGSFARQETLNDMNGARLVLRRPVSTDLTFWQWHEVSTMGDSGARKSFTLTTYAGDGAVMTELRVSDGYVSQVEVGMLPGSDAMTETVTVTAPSMLRVR